MTVIEQMGAKAKEAARVLSVAGSKKDLALNSIADALIEHKDEIIKANNIDIEYAKAHQIRVANVAGYSTESKVWLMVSERYLPYLTLSVM